MENFRIIIKNGRIVNYEGEVSGKWDCTYIAGNGWYCTVSEYGTITCIASKKYPDGKHMMKFVLTPGTWAKLTFKTEKSKFSKIIKIFRMKKGPINGVITLSDGRIDNRRAYFIAD